MTFPEGLLLVNKEKGKNSFSIVYMLRKRTGIKKIGHTGTLDPLAEGLMVLLIGKKYTRLCDKLICDNKEYLAKLCLGFSSATYDKEGTLNPISSKVPTQEEVITIINRYQGTLQQIPPMFSAKKVNGQKLCDLARKGKEIERKPGQITVKIDLINYAYPFIDLKIFCSKGTYVRSLAHDIGHDLGTGAYLENLQRTQSGKYHLKDALDQKYILDINCPLENYIIH